MAIFTSRSPESYDPEPWLDHWGGRVAEPFKGALALVYDPRPEFEPTRDAEPWLAPDGTRWQEKCITDEEWAPRDRNRNRILIAFRSDRDHIEMQRTPIEWLADELEIVGAPFYTPAEVEHARKVLSRLVKAGV